MVQKKPFKIKVFLPETRLLNDAEINQLPAEKIRSAQAAGKEGLWLEINNLKKMR